jgi:diguanylate cyclase (GGDEF)-like protein
MRDVLAQAEWLYLGLAMPSGLLVAAAMRLDPPPLVREGLQGLTDTVSALCMLYLMFASKSTDAQFFASTVILLMMFSCIAAQSRFAFACATTAAILGGSAVGLLLAKPAWAQPRDLVLLVQAACFAVLANWRLERGMRQNYLLALRERLRRQDLAQRNDELGEMARLDSLTGLANRRAHDASLAAVWERALLDGSRVGFVIVDVDNFKAFNDHHGHPGGDLCLQTLARAMGEQLRGTTDLLARVGGEEFAILLPGLGEDVCADIAERVRQGIAALELPHGGVGAGGMVTVSAGVASLEAQPGFSTADLFAAADAALYRAKRDGRNRVCVGALGTPVVASELAAGARSNH